MKALYKVLPHILIILAGMFLTLYVVDGYNPTMEFIDNDISKTLLAIFAAVAIVNAILFIRLQRKQ